jgi:hypothetical protein
VSLQLLVEIANAPLVVIFQLAFQALIRNLALFCAHIRLCRTTAGTCRRFFVLDVLDVVIVEHDLMHAVLINYLLFRVKIFLEAKEAENLMKYSKFV